MKAKSTYNVLKKKRFCQRVSTYHLRIKIAELDAPDDISILAIHPADFGVLMQDHDGRPIVVLPCKAFDKKTSRWTCWLAFVDHPDKPRTVKEWALLHARDHKC